MFTNFDLHFLVYFFSSILLALIVTPLTIKLAFKLKVLDIPKSPRKIHKSPMPLLGGFAVFLVFSLVVFAYLIFGDVDFLFVPQRFFLSIILVRRFHRRLFTLNPFRIF